MEEARVGIISDDTELIESVVQSWRQSQHSPKFAVAGLHDSSEALRSAVVLTDSVRMLSRLSPGVILAIAITPDGEVAEADESAQTHAQPAGSPRMVRIPRRTGWAEEAAALAQETVLRLESQAQVAEMKQRLREAERFATLGRFFVEARHGLGNALTGVLGNSELLLLEGEKDLQGQARAKVEAIRQMSLKLHETLHRLSSLDLELRRQAEQESVVRPQP